ncbi:MAG: T9SS type A sorting domain-containing protein [Bacteroidota bacterium]
MEKILLKKIFSLSLLNRKILLPSILLFCFISSFSATYYSRQTGNWTANTSWNTDAVFGPGGTQAAAGAYPGSAAGDIAIIGDGGAAGVITISYPTNTANSLASVTMQDDAVLTFGNNSRTLTTTGNFTINGTNSITGGNANRVFNVGGTFNVSAGATCDIGGITLTVTGVTTINGTVTFSVNTGPKTFSSAVTINSGGIIDFTSGQTITLSASLTMNGTAIIGSASTNTTGTVNVGTTFTVSAGATASIGRCVLNITSTTDINGTLTFAASATGAKTFSGNLTINNGAIIDFTVASTLTLSSGLIMNGTATLSSAATTATGTINAGTTFTVSAGATASIGRITLSVTSASDISGTLTITNTTGTKTLTGNVTIGTAGNITFSAAETLTMSNGLTTNPGAIIGGGTAVGIITVGGTFTSASGGTTTLNGNLTFSAAGLAVPGTAVLSATASTNDISISGNWNITSTDPDPFREGTCSVTLNGTSGTQIISNPLGTETFYNLFVTNTSATVPAIQTNAHITVTNDFDHTSGSTIDLNSKNLTIAGAATGAQTISFTSGVIMTSVAGSSITITETNTLSVDWLNYRTGDATNGVPITLTSSNSTWEGSTFYGTTNFTKTGSTSESFSGGNIFYGPCTFTTNAGANRWRMGDDSASPDIFYNGTFTHNGSSNFILCANSTGNEFYGTTNITSTSSGGVYIGRVNGTPTSSSSTFHGPVVVTVALTGNVTFAEGATGYTGSVTFESTIQINSAASSTGDIYFGNNANSTVTLTNNAGQFIAGTISGRTSIYLRNVTQNGTALIQTISGPSNSKIFCGSTGTPNLPCTFNAGVVFSTDSVTIAQTTFNGNATITGSSYFVTSYSSYNGTTNTLQQNGSGNGASAGGNVFAAATTTTIIANGTGYIRFGNTVGDDFNGNVIFNQLNTGSLAPAYNATSTFAGNISTVGTSTAITFASAANGRVTIDGSSNQTINGAPAQSPVIKRLTMATSANATFTLNVPLNISSGGDLTMTTGKIITTTTNILTLDDETTTTTVGNSSSYVDGPMQYEMTTNSATRSILNFPVGKSADWRPVSLQVANNVNTSYTYRAEAFNQDAESLNWTKPSTIDTVSWVRYWDVDRYLTSTMVSTPSTNLRTTVGTNEPIITLYFGSNDYVKDGANLTICKNTSAALTTWIDIGGTGAPAYSGGTNLTGSVTSTSSPTAFNSFSRFTIASRTTGWNPLPVKLLSFTATPHNSSVELNWTTVTEINNDFFTVERSSDGADFENIGIVDGAGNNTSVLDYSLTDDNPYKGSSYYRLKQTDFDGKYTYSDIVAVKFDNTNNFIFNVYPNPANAGNNLNLSIEGNVGEEILVVVCDMVGKESFSKIMVIQTEGKNVYAIDESKKLSPGIYIIIATSNQNVYSKKLIIK